MIQQITKELAAADEGFQKLSKNEQRITVLEEALKRAAAEFGKLGDPGVHDSIVQLGAAFENIKGKVASALDRNDEFAKTIQTIKHDIETTDPAILVDALTSIAKAATLAYGEVSKLLIGFDSLFGSSPQAHGGRNQLASNLLNGVATVLEGPGGVGKNSLTDAFRERANNYLARNDAIIQDQLDRRALEQELNSFNPKAYQDRTKTLRGPDSPEPDKAAIKAAKEAQKALEELGKKRDEIFAKSQQESDLLGLQKAIQAGDSGGIAAFAQKLHDDTSKELATSLSDTLKKAGLGTDSQLFADTLAAKVSLAFSKAAIKSNEDIAKSQAKLAADALGFALQDAEKNGNLNLVKQLQDQISSGVFADTKQKALSQLLVGQLPGTKEYEQALELAQTQASAAKAVQDQQNAHHLEELQKQAFQNSVSFFEDLLSSAIDGTGKNLEQTLLEALKKVGIGFASQIGANLLGKLGFNGLGGISSAAGLGQSLATTLGFGGGGVQGIGSLFGGAAGGAGLTASATALDGSAVALTNAAGAIAAAAGTLKIPGVPQGLGGSILPGGAGLSTLSATALSAGAVIIGTGVGAALLANGIKQGGTTGAIEGGAGGALAGGSLFGGLGAGLLGPVGIAAGLFGGSLFGGDSKLAAERQAREEAIKQFGDKFGGTSFNTIQGPYNLNKNDYNTTGLNPQSVGFAKPLAELFTGGSGKGADDLTGIFAHGIDQAKNFNEEILNTQSLLAKMGTNANDAKQGIFQLFKDGKISLSDFTQGLQNLNLVSQDTFTGPNGIQEGFKAIEQQLGSGTNQGLVGAVAGLSTEMNTFAKQGLKTTTDVANYFAKAGDTLHAKFFQLLASQGYKTADDLKKALSDPNLFAQLLSDLQNAGDLSGGLASATRTTTAAVTKTGTQGASAMNTYKKSVDDSKASVDNLTASVLKLQAAQAGAAASGGTVTGGTALTGGSGGSGGTSGTTGAGQAGRTRSRQLGFRTAHGL